MTLTVAKNGRWRLVGTPDEFADITGFPDYDTYDDLKVSIAHITENTSTKFKDHRGWYELTGSRSDLAEIAGFPEARTVVETLGAFEQLHPKVKVLSS